MNKQLHPTILHRCDYLAMSQISASGIRISVWYDKLGRDNNPNPPVSMDLLCIIIFLTHLHLWHIISFSIMLFISHNDRNKCNYLPQLLSTCLNNTRGIIHLLFLMISKCWDAADTLVSTWICLKRHRILFFSCTYTYFLPPLFYKQ